MAELKLLKMSEIQSKSVDWLWQQYIPYGAITLLQGDGGLGKTTISLAIASAITRGELLPSIHGGGFTAPASVILQNAEDSYTETINPRLEQLGADCARIHVIDEEETPLTFTDERIEQAIIRTGAKLVILDPVQGYFGRANMNAANSVRPVMKQLGRIAERYRCAILLVGHLGKSNSKAAYRGLGSIDIYSAVRSVLTVGKIEGEDYLRAIVHQKSNLAPNGASIAFEIDPVTGFKWCGEYAITIDELLEGKAPDKPLSQLDKASDLIKDAIFNGRTAANDIIKAAENHGISEKTLYRAKSKLGVFSAKRGEDWFWEFPIEGEYRECSGDKNTRDGQVGQHGQSGHNSKDSQGGQITELTTLSILNENEVDRGDSDGDHVD